MPTLSANRISELLEPYLGGVDPAPSTEVSDKKLVIAKLEAYLDLLLRWNARTNLTAIREPEAIVSRHFGESLFAARILSPQLIAGASLLDFGSGAGFPGLPIQLYRPDLQVTLAESQGKKAAFLREAIRTLDLKTEVWAARVEAMPSNRLFDCVTLRAVDRMADAMRSSFLRIAPGGVIAVLGGEASESGLTLPFEAEPLASHDIPQSERNRLLLYRASQD